MNEAWSKIDCPHCDKANWVNYGDLNDQTIPDIEAIKCWSCKKKSFVDKDFIIDNYLQLCSVGFENLDQFLQDGAFCVNGMKNPMEFLRDFLEE